MKKILQNTAPAVIVGLLLLANLLPLDGWTQKDPAPETKRPPQTEIKTAPTPVDPPNGLDTAQNRILASYPDLPGRLFFLREESLGILERGDLTWIPLPEEHVVTAPPAESFSPDGRQMALFGKIDNQLFLQVSKLQPGQSPDRLFPVDESGPVRWSPDGKEVLTWSLDRLSLRMADGRFRALTIPNLVTDAVWSPDGLKVAIETRIGSLYLLDRQTGELTEIEGEVFDPVWGPRGQLLYLRLGAPIQSYWRTPEGEELAGDLTQTEAWQQAKVVDLFYSEDSPGLQSRPGRPPEQIRLISQQPGRWRDSLLFTFREDERLGVGYLREGALQLWLYPARPEPTCQPFKLQDLPGGLFVAAAAGESCSLYWYRVKHGSDQIQEIHDRGLFMIDTTGTWTVSQSDGRLSVTDLDRLRGSVFEASERPIYWDGP